jgi:hypothetical protein
MEALGGERRYSSYSFTTSALDGGEWSASRPGRALPPGKGPPGTHCTGGWVGPRAGLDTEARGKIRCLCRGSNPDRPVVQPEVRHYTAWANPAPVFISTRRILPVQCVKTVHCPSHLSRLFNKFKSVTKRCDSYRACLYTCIRGGLAVTCVIEGGGELVRHTLHFTLCTCGHCHGEGKQSADYITRLEIRSSWVTRFGFNDSYASVYQYILSYL